MNRSLRRTTGLAALALTATFSFAACSGSDSEGSATDDTSASSTPTEEPTPSESTDTGTDAAAQTFGAGCAAVPADGAGSFNGMATEPVATAASANPALSTLVTAVGEAGLVDTLNTQEGITVFAPVNDAFAAVPKKALDSLLADKAALTKVLTYHVVAGQLSPEDVAGTHKTLEGEDLTVKGSGEDFTVGAGNATVVCGNVPTANATVYLIDSVLMPPSMG